MSGRRRNLEGYERRILLVTAVAVLIIGTLVALASLLPLHGRLKEAQEQTLLFSMRTRTLTVESYVSKVKNLAIQITSRTRIRDYLVSYNRGEIDLDELAEFSAPKLADAIAPSPDMLGVGRLDPGGELVVETGTLVPSEFWPIPAPGSAEALVRGPVTHHGGSYLVVGAPILDREGIRQGTDIVLFDTSGFYGLISDDSGLGRTGETILGVQNGAEAASFFPLARTPAGPGGATDLPAPLAELVAAASTGQTGVRSVALGPVSTTVAFGPIAGAPWGILAKMDSEELLASIQPQFTAIGALVLVLIGLGVLGAVSLIRPLTRAVQTELEERIRAQQELELFRDLINRSSDAILVIEPSTSRLIDLNDRACTGLGYARQELLEKTVPDIDGSILDHEAWEAHVEEMRRVGSLIRASTHRRRDGSSFPVEVNVSLVTAGDKEFIVAAARDRTERQRLEQELQKSHKIESVGLLAGGIAHDFNNILTAALSNLSLAKLALDPDSPAQERLSGAETALERAATLTQQLLTFSKGGAPVRQVTSMADLIRESTEFALAGSNVRCELSMADDLWLADVDPGQIHQVVHNLVVNADQAMPDGGVIEITASNQELATGTGLPIEAGRYLRLTFEDSGLGIPKKHQGKIFDPYFSTKQKGSGLGLSVSYSIVKKHGGHIEVRSEPGVGTSFDILLPAAPDGASAAHRRPWARPASGGTVLIMDDEEMVRKTAGGLLEHLGYGVDFACNGEEALEKYAYRLQTGERFDAVLVDLTIPGGMGGVETVRRLREIDPRVRAIVSSGYSNDPAMAEFQRFGFTDVLAKPYTTENLSAVLRRVVASAD